MMQLLLMGAISGVVWLMMYMKPEEENTRQDFMAEKTFYFKSSNVDQWISQVNAIRFYMNQTPPHY